MAMKEIDIREVKENLVHLLADEWALVTAGRGDALGTMTVSWGGIGELWGKDMATIYIRPQRYTKKFLDENNYFTLSFYPEQYKDAVDAYLEQDNARANLSAAIMESIKGED